MLSKTFFVAAAFVLALATPSKVDAWGCYHASYHYGGSGGGYHAGYTHVGYGGVEHYGTTGGYHSGGSYGGYHYGGYHYGGSNACYARRW